ncbi:MAG: hypothetical protein R3F38_01815 [Gammaproteobacteria bacterium]
MELNLEVGKRIVIATHAGARLLFGFGLQIGLISLRHGSFGALG